MPSNELQDAKSLRISKLWVELQSQGIPPPEITNSTSNINMFGTDSFCAETSDLSNNQENCLLM